MTIRKYSFLDDYSEGCHPTILTALAQTNISQQTAYGNDEYSEEARHLILDKCQSDSDVYFVAGGTLANIIIHSASLRSHEAVVTAYNGHINRHETGAIEATGHKVITCPSENGKLTVAMLEETLEHYSLTPHMVKPRLVYISNATELGTIYSKSELETLSSFCKSNDLLFMLDGARLGSALVSDKSDVDLSDVAKLTDIFWIGGTKMGALIGEAIVINNYALKKDFAYCIKQRGALTAKGRVLGVQFKELFTNDLYFELARTTNASAKKLADGFLSKGYQLASQLESNQVFPILPNEVIERLEENFSFYVWGKVDENSSSCRFVTSWATDTEQIERLINLL